MTLPFTTLSGYAIPMPQDNIDTDIIFPGRFLLITAKVGLGRYAFHDYRYDASGAEIPGYVLNREPFRPDGRQAPIIIAGANFGSGSSREHAVWTIADIGVRAIIATGFSEIFHSNAQRNGVLPITLPAETIAELLIIAEAGEIFAIDLSAQSIAVAGLTIHFDIPPERKLALMNGWDETTVLLNQYGDAIDHFETRQKATCPWLYAKDDSA